QLGSFGAAVVGCGVDGVAEYPDDLVELRPDVDRDACPPNDDPSVNGRIGKLTRAIDCLPEPFTSERLVAGCAQRVGEAREQLDSLDRGVDANVVEGQGQVRRRGVPRVPAQRVAGRDARPTGDLRRRPGRGGGQVVSDARGTGPRVVAGRGQDGLVDAAGE